MQIMENNKKERMEREWNEMRMTIEMEWNEWNGIETIE